MKMTEEVVKYPLSKSQRKKLKAQEYNRQYELNSIREEQEKNRKELVQKIARQAVKEALEEVRKGESE